MRWVSGLLLMLALAAPAQARPKTGRIIRCQDWLKPGRWLRAVRVDPRCEFIIPVNVVRIYSNEHSAVRIAPRNWLNAQFQIANWLYSFPENEMRQYTGTRKAPCLQFRINKIYDVHENDVGAALGYRFDTEKVVGAGRQTHNGPRISGTQDLRQLKVGEAADMLTLFCVWSLKQPSHLAQEFGGESNIGFTEQMPTGPRRVLRRVIAERARMGVVAARQANSWMNTIAHEFGHYFGLWHAWERAQNTRNGLTDIGKWVKGKVDSAPGYGNCMDYDNGPKVQQYFARSQLNFMFKFARDKASTQIQIKRQGGSVTPPPDVRTQLKAKFKALRVSATPGGPVKIEGDFDIEGAKGKKGSFTVWFNDQTGQKLRDNDKKHRTVDGQVAAWTKIEPGFDRTAYNKFKVELPAGQLHLSPGTHKLQANAGIVFNGKVLAVSNWAKFTYTVPARTAKPAGKVAAWITSAKVTPGVVLQGKRWVKIESDVVLDNLIGKDVWVEARYFLSDGRQLKDFDKQYVSNGWVYANRKIVPKDPRTNRKTVLWLPEAQLHLLAGVRRLYATVTVRYGGRNLASTSTHMFTVGRKKSVARPPVGTLAKANFESVWVTHSHTEGAKTGLRVHCRFSVSGSKGRPINIVAWFWDAKGKKLKDFNGLYKSSDGQASTSRKFTPLYPSTRFSDAWLFIPYSELHLRSGTHRLGVTVGIFSGNKSIGSMNDLKLFNVTWR